MKIHIRWKSVIDRHLAEKRSQSYFYEKKERESTKKDYVSQLNVRESDEKSKTSLFYQRIQNHLKRIM